MPVSCVIRNGDDGPQADYVVESGPTVCDEHRESAWQTIARPGHQRLSKRYSIPSFLILYRNDLNVMPSSCAALVLL